MRSMERDGREAREKGGKGIVVVRLTVEDAARAILIEICFGRFDLW
jgi:hypothetical protein